MERGKARRNEALRLGTGLVVGLRGVMLRYLSLLEGTRSIFFNGRTEVRGE
jgi:hypothetical protein